MSLDQHPWNVTIQHWVVDRIFNTGSIIAAVNRFVRNTRDGSSCSNTILSFIENSWTSVTNVIYREYMESMGRKHLPKDPYWAVVYKACLLDATIYQEEFMYFPIVSSVPDDHGTTTIGTTMNIPKNKTTFSEFHRELCPRHHYDGKVLYFDEMKNAMISDVFYKQLQRGQLGIQHMSMRIGDRQMFHSICHSGLSLPVTQSRPSSFRFLLIEYLHPESPWSKQFSGLRRLLSPWLPEWMSANSTSVTLQLDDADYMTGNVILSYAHVLRMLKHQPQWYVFDGNYRVRVVYFDASFDVCSRDLTSADCVRIVDDTCEIIPVSSFR